MYFGRHTYYTLLCIEVHACIVCFHVVLWLSMDVRVRAAMVQRWLREKQIKESVLACSLAMLHGEHGNCAILARVTLQM